MGYELDGLVCYLRDDKKTRARLTFNDPWGPSLHSEFSSINKNTMFP